MLVDPLTPTLDFTFRALSDPRRRWYLECLLDGDVRLCEFAELFPLSQPTVIHHLRVLEECRLLSSRKQGPERLYSLRPERLEEAEDWLRRLCWHEHQPGCRSPLRFG